MEIGIDKDFLISEFHRYFDEYGVYPSSPALKKANGYPSVVSYIQTWGNWSTFLKDTGIFGDHGWLLQDEQMLREKYEICSREEINDSLIIKKSWDTIKKKAGSLGLKRNKSLAKRKFNDEFLLEKLKELSIQLGKTPTCEDLNSNKDLPCHHVYLERFGSWNNALSMINLKLNTNFDHSKEAIINEVIAFYNTNERSPYYNELSYSKTAISNYWESWTELLKECDLPLNKIENILITKNDGISYLQDLYGKLERVPSSLDVAKDGVPRDWFARNFGSYRLALFEAGLIDSSEVEYDYDEFADNSIKYLNELANELNRIPSVEEFQEHLNKKETRNFLSRENLSIRLNKKFTEICKMYLPVEILESEANKFYFDIKNNRCLSLPEMKISNLLIENNITFIGEPSYKEVMDISERLRFDWKIEGEKTIYVEYFGLYTEETTDGDYLYEYHNKTKRKIMLCKQNDVPLIELYPYDLKNNFNGLLNKFKEHGIELILKQVS